MSRKKKKTAPAGEKTYSAQTDGAAAEEGKSASSSYREIQKAWQKDHLKQVEAEREAERAREEKEKQKKADEAEHERVTELLAEAVVPAEPLELDVGISVRDLYRFHLYNIFHSSSGILAIVGAALVAVVAFFTAGKIGTIYTVIYFICAAVFLIYYPLIGYVQARVQMKRSPILSNSLHYTFLDSGIDVLSQAVEEDNEAVLDWADIEKAVETGSELFIYTGKTDGYILPKDLLSAKMPKIRKRLRAGLPAEILHLRGGRKDRT